MTLRRRTFIAGLGATAAWPLAARGQQRVPVIGFVTINSPEGYHFLAPFRQGLQESGFVEGQNVHVEYRWGQNQPERVPDLVADLVQHQVDAIVTGARVGEIAKTATKDIPVVFISGGDPVASGLVPSLNRPGGNLTGVTLISADLGAKRLGLLHDLVPQASIIGILADATGPTVELQVQELRTAARSLGLSVRTARAANEKEIEPGVASLIMDGAGALVATASNIFLNLRERVTSIVARRRIPAMYEVREFAEAGGLMTYGPSVPDAFRSAGIYVGRILRGERPSEMPVMQPTKFDFVLNLKSAKALGLTVPPNLLALADEVIE